MGSTHSNYSANIEVPSSFRYFGIQFIGENILRLVAPPREVLDDTRAILSQLWSGCQTNSFSGYTDLQLNASPWYSSADEVSVKYFISALIKKYYELGWHIRVSTDLNWKGHDTSMLMFEKLNPIKTNIICLCLSESDLLRVLAPNDLIPYIQTSIMTFWPKGISQQQRVNESFEFQLKGLPWDKYDPDSDDSFHGTALINNIFATLYNLGWVFVAAIDSAKFDKCVKSIYLRYDPEETNKPENQSSNFFAISLNEVNKIRIISSTHDMRNLIRSVIRSNWTRGIEDEKAKCEGWQFKLGGSPWECFYDEAVESKKLICNLIQVLNDQNWKFYATCTLSANIKAKSTFFFRTSPLLSHESHRILCISPFEFNKIRVIDTKPTMNINLLNSIQYTLRQSWPFGIKAENDFYGSWQYSLNNGPFDIKGSSHKSANTCLTMLSMLSTVQKFGMPFLTSAYLNGTSVGRKYQSPFKIGIDCWLFIDRT